MALSYLTSTLVMATFLAVTAAAIIAAGWRRPEAAPAHGGHDEAFFSLLERGSKVLHSGSVWALLFVGAVAVAGLAALAFVGGLGGEAVAGLAGTALVAVTALGVLAFLFTGTYYMARSRGLASSYSAAAGAWTVATLVLAAVVAVLLLD